MSGHWLDPERVAEWNRRTRLDQGLSPTLVDPGVLARIAKIMTGRQPVPAGRGDG